MKKIIAVLFFCCSISAFAGDLTLCYKSEPNFPTNTFSDGYWDNKVLDNPTWKGLVIFARRVTNDDSNERITFYLPNYHGKGKYILAGTKSMEYGSVTNAVWYLLGCYSVAPNEENKMTSDESIVTVSEDDGVKISGTFQIVVRYNGDAKNEPKTMLSGSFRDLIKNPK